MSSYLPMAVQAFNRAEPALIGFTMGFMATKGVCNERQNLRTLTTFLATVAVPLPLLMIPNSAARWMAAGTSAVVTILGVKRFRLVGVDKRAALLGLMAAVYGAYRGDYRYTAALSFIAIYRFAYNVFQRRAPNKLSQLYPLSVCVNHIFRGLAILCAAGTLGKITDWTAKDFKQGKYAEGAVCATLLVFYLSNLWKSRLALLSLEPVFKR